MNTAYAVTIAAALIVVARLLTFRRRAGRYRPGIAMTAWLIIVASTFVAIFGPAPSEVTGWFVAVAMVVLAIGLIRTGGNVAHLLRPFRRL